MSTAAFLAREFPGAWFPKELYCDTRISANTRFLIAEVRALSQNGRPCWASDRHFSEFLCVSERQVRRLLAEAEEAGWIRREMIETGANGGHTRIIHCLFGFFGPTSCQPLGGVDISVRTGWTDSSTIESHGLDKSKAKAEAVQPYHEAMVLPRARAHEEPADDWTVSDRLAALKAPPATDPSPTPTDPVEPAPDPPPAILLAAFDTQPWEGPEQGSKGGECSSEAAEPLCPLEEILEDLMQIELSEDLDDLRPDPRTPPSPAPDPPSVPEFTPRDDSEGARLLVARGVAHDIAEQLGSEQNLSRVRDVCELAAIKGWNAGILVRCFAAGWDREAPNRRRLAAARGLPTEDPPPAPRPAARHSTPEFEPVDEEYQRFLRGQLTPEEREKHEAQQAFLREQAAALFPERSRPDGSRKVVVPPADPVPVLVGASDPRPIAEIMAKPEFVPGGAP